MDAAFFRYLGPELSAALLGVRFDTVFNPGPNFWTFVFSPPVGISPHCPPGRRFLLLRAHPRQGHLFFATHKPVNPASASAKAMWLRKRLRGRKVVGAEVCWSSRRLALELSRGEGGYLLLGMEEDPAVLERLPDAFGQRPAWLDAGDVRAVATHPQAPRSLRHALEHAGPEDAPALLRAFEAGTASGFFVSEPPGASAGPLPWPQARNSLRYASALEAAQAYAAAFFFAALAPPAEDPRAARKRQDRLLANLDQDRQRLHALTRQQVYAETLAANLSILDPKSRSGPLVLEHPAEGTLTVPLKQSLTVIENMERFFAKAAKGRRGLGHVERLRQEALAGQGTARTGIRQAGQSGAKRKPASSDPKAIAVHRFRSSDGFVILRGKNSAANHQLLTKLSRPFDYWFHAEGGPGAHVILQRDHFGQDVPEQSLREAAILAALAGWQAKDAKASVLMALARDVRTITGAAQGRVAVASVRSLLVEIDPDAVARLRIMA